MTHDLPDPSGMVVPGILRDLEPESFAALALGGTPPVLLDSGPLHRLLDLGIELTALIEGHYETHLKLDSLGASEILIRVDTRDWEQAAKALHSWARAHIQPGDGNKVQADHGFISLFLPAVGIARCWSARLAPSVEWTTFAIPSGAMERAQ